MTAQQLEDFAQQIAVATVAQIPLSRQPNESDEDYKVRLNIEAQSWALRSRNLAKFWASKAPVQTDPLNEEEADVLHMEELKQEKDQPVRRKPGRPARQ